MTRKSHTRTLLERVKTEEAHGTEAGVIRQTIALAEYVREYRENIDADELAAAEDLLIIHCVDTPDGDISDDDFSERVTAILAADANGKGACIRCGRILSRPQSVEKRMGPTCLAKAAEDNWDFKGEDTTVDIRKSFMRCNDIKPLKDKTRLGLKKIAEHFGVSLSVVRRDRRELKKVIEVENKVHYLITGDVIDEDTLVADTDGPILKEETPNPEMEEALKEVNEHFDPSITCVIYKRKGDGSHCKKQCKNSKQ